MKKCKSCGIIRRTVIKCSRCQETICINCFHFTTGLCPDCMIETYAEKYAEKLIRYANETA